mmetsp:Transcript_25135/g.63273  ORF Transcript_25135/g.63273 Transcript_25135/m.63273 type:complete len:326 (+) Transcript_25135:1716-2693(+)
MAMLVLPPRSAPARRVQGLGGVILVEIASVQAVAGGREGLTAVFDELCGHLATAQQLALQPAAACELATLFGIAHRARALLLGGRGTMRSVPVWVLLTVSGRCVRAIALLRGRDRGRGEEVRPCRGARLRCVYLRQQLVQVVGCAGQRRLLAKRVRGGRRPGAGCRRSSTGRCARRGPSTGRHQGPRGSSHHAVLDQRDADAVGPCFINHFVLLVAQDAAPRANERIVRQAGCHYAILERRWGAGGCRSYRSSCACAGGGASCRTSTSYRAGTRSRSARAPFQHCVPGNLRERGTPRIRFQPRGGMAGRNARPIQYFVHGAATPA